jgi:hypothetical protein
MSRYRKVFTKTWADEKFRALSRPHPNGQSLFLYLLTGPHTGPIPGLSSVGEAAMAEALRWPLEGFREAFREVFAKALAKADWEARVVFLPNALKYNRPESPNVVKSWATAFEEIPECELKEEAFRAFKAFTEDMGEGFAEAFRKAFPKDYAYSGAGAGAGSRKQEEAETTPSAADAASESAPIEGQILTGNGHRPVTGKSKKRKHHADGPAEFVEFCQRYPKVRKWDKTLEAWQKINPDAATCAAIFEGLDRYLASEDWAREGGRFIPHSTSWLNGGCWKDHPTPASGLSLKTAGNLDVGHRFIAKLRADQDDDPYKHLPKRPAVER